MLLCLLNGFKQLLFSLGLQHVPTSLYSKLHREHAAFAALQRQHELLGIVGESEAFAKMW